MTDEHTEECPDCGADITSVIDGLKGVLAKTREEKKRYKENAKKFHGDVTRLKSELKDGDPELRTELNAVKEALADTVPKSDFDNLTTELEESKTTAAKLQDEATQGKIASAVAKAGGNLAMLSPMIKAKLVENPKLDLDEHLATLRSDADFGGAFKSSDQSGGGSDPGKGNDTHRIGITSLPMRRSEMSDKQKNEFQKSHGLSALLDLPL